MDEKEGVDPTIRGYGCGRSPPLARLDQRLLAYGLRLTVCTCIYSVYAAWRFRALCNSRITGEHDATHSHMAPANMPRYRRDACDTNP